MTTSPPSTHQKHFVHSKVNTKSLLGRQALIGILQEKVSYQNTPARANSPFISSSALPAEEGPSSAIGESGNAGFSFNNNIYNNFSPSHSIDQVDDPSSRMHSTQDRHKVAVIKQLKLEGKIKSTGRSPVPLRLYDTPNAEDHLYINKVTKRVPVAHD